MDGDLYREKTIIEQRVQVSLLVMTCCQSAGSYKPKSQKNVDKRIYTNVGIQSCKLHQKMPL